MKFAKPIVFIICLIPAARIGWGIACAVIGCTPPPFLAQHLGVNPIRDAEIQTGLWTLRFLAIALAITPARRITHWNVLGKYRRMLGLFTFFYACVHLSLWFVDWWFDWPAMWGEIVKHKFILIGMLTFLILVPLAITSTNGWIKRLGKRWTKLHRLVYVAAITGTIHYLWGLSSKEGSTPTFPMLYLATFALLLGYRVYDNWRKNHPRQPVRA
jgi:methionine sulfoxide reductase heme-binding subunit